MAAANSAECLQEEASCSVCLDYFTDPVTTDCGHNFCRSCITQSWKGRDKNFPCPQCKKIFRQRNFRPNGQLANLIEIARKLCQNSVRPKEENLCEEHEEKLKLFCKEDQKCICVVCDKSQDHRSHTTILIEEAVQEYKNIFKMHLELLRKQWIDILKFKSDEEKKAEKLRSETKIKRWKAECEFEELHQFLNQEKQILLLRLKEEEEKILQRIRENLTQLDEQSSFLTQLISEIETKIQQPAIELLKGVKDALSRCQKMKFSELKGISSDLKMNFQLSYPHQLQKLVAKFGDWWMEYGRNAVDVTLDPKTAHPDLLLSDDQKSVRRGNKSKKLPESPENFNTDHCVLGCESFISGRHYWEVEMGAGTGWKLGVCKDSVMRKGRIRTSPGEGYWAVELCDDGEYWALVFPEIPLLLSKKPRAVGILLDYEAGKVSFYNADNKSHIYTFTDTFTGKLRPFFCTYSNDPLRIQLVPVWD